MKQLENISKGKELQVGHHQIHPQANRPRTLHEENSKRVAERIDIENKKILAAILRVKPSNPVRKDKNHIER